MSHGTGKRNYALCGSSFMVAALVVATAGSSAWADTGHARLVAYAGQVSASISGEYPVGFRFIDANGNLVYEETVTADVRQGRIIVYAGRARGDMTGVLQQSGRMDVSFQGTALESLPVIHTTRADLAQATGKSSPMRAVWLVDDEGTSEHAAESQCRIVRSGFVTVPFTNTTVGAASPGCAAGELAVSGGYSLLTTPSQGVMAMGLFSYFTTNWQMNYEVKNIPATLELTNVCCL